MLLAREQGGWKLYADTYTLEFPADRPFVHLVDPQGARIAELFVLSSVHPLFGRDDTTAIDMWRVEEGLDQVVCTLETRSSAWERKTIRFRCLPRRFQYEVEVEGRGQIAEAQIFGGYSSAQIRWGSGLFHSGQAFQQIFNPEPNADEEICCPGDSTTSINLSGVPLPGKADWFFTPPPFCFAAQLSSGWVGMSLEPQPGQNLFTEYIYHGSRGAFHLSLLYEGTATVDGKYCLPAVAFDMAQDPYTLLALHIHHLRSAGLVPTPSSKQNPSWWNEPIFCGWGAQCALAKQSEGRAPDFATQDRYEAFLHALDLQGLAPGTIVLDDKWQETYGENNADTQKWRDLPGFVRARHAEGRRVLLWLKAWDPQGIPLEECIRNAAGLPVSVDPTNPAFEQRLRASVRRMLSDEAYGADGFKIDFSARIPTSPNLQMYRTLGGLELMRCYLSIIYDEAKRVKPDALVITHTPHPYLADVVDAIRLNDINTLHDVPTQMRHRARVAAIACPEAAIDMDNWPMRDKAAWLSYLQQRPLLGIPALYFVSSIDSTGEPLTEEDYAMLRNVWEEYRAAVAAKSKRVTGEKIGEAGGFFLPGANPLVKRLDLHRTISIATKPLKALDQEELRDNA